MYTLFLDTHGEEIIVALVSNDIVIEKRQVSLYKHAVYLVPMIESIMKENNVSFKSIKNIVAINGPGSFTGLRIGLTVAKTLAYTLKKPIYLVSTLKAYLVSSSGDGVSIIEDNNGYYVCSRNNGVFSKEEYVKEEVFYKNIVLNYIDVKKVVEYALTTESINPHLVRANYVKKIEAEK